MRNSFHVACALVVVLIGSSSQAHAQWRTNGAVVCNAPGDQLGLDAAEDGAGGIYAVWTDERSAPIAVYLQHLTLGGEPYPGWPANGLLLAANPHSSFNGRGNARVVADGAGGAIVVWRDRQHHPGSCTWNLLAQRVTASGSLLWGSDGSSVIGDSSAYGYSCFDLLPDENGGAFVSWEAGCIDSQTDARVQHLSSVGLRQWGVSGLAVESSREAEGFCPGLAPDGAGGVFVEWTGRAADPNYEAKLQHVSAAGTALWSVPIPPTRSGLGVGRDAHGHRGAVRSRMAPLTARPLTKPSLQPFNPPSRPGLFTNSVPQTGRDGDRSLKYPRDPFPVSDKKNILDQLVQFVLSIVFGMLVVQWVVALLVQTVALLWAHTFGSAVGQILGALLVIGLAVLFGFGLLVRFGKGISSFWRHTLELFHGPRRERGQRVRGAQHLPRTRVAKRRRAVDDDLPLPGRRVK